MSIKEKFVNFKEKLSKFFFRKERNYVTGLIVGIVIFLFIIILYYSNSFYELETSIQALIYQLGYKLPSNPDLVTVVKKDNISSFLLNTDPGRREYASLIKFLGSSQKRDRLYKSRNQIYELFALKFGIFNNIRDQYPITTSFNEWCEMKDLGDDKDKKNIEYFNQDKWLGYSRQVFDFFKENKDKEGFSSFIKVKGKSFNPKGISIFEFLAGGNNYLFFPTLCIDWNSEKTKKEINSIINQDFDEDDFKEKISKAGDSDNKKKIQSIEEIVRRWCYFCENLLYANITYDIKLFPKSKNKDENTFFSLSIKLKTQARDTSYIVGPVSVLGFDYILQGEKVEDVKGDKLLEEALNNCQSKVVLAAKKSEDLIEDDIVEDEKGYSKEIRTNNNHIQDEEIKTIGNTDKKSEKKNILEKPFDCFLSNKDKVDYAMIDMRANNKSYITDVPIIVKVDEDIYDKEGKKIATQTIKPSFALRLALEHMDFEVKNIFPKELAEKKEEKEKLLKLYSNNCKILENSWKSLNIRNLYSGYIEKSELESEISKLETRISFLDNKIANSEPSYVNTQKEIFEKIRKKFCDGDFDGNLQIKDLEIPINRRGFLYVRFAGSTRKGKLGKAGISSVSLFECLDEEMLKKYYIQSGYNDRLLPSFAYRRVLGRKKKNKGGKLYLFGPYQATDFDFYPTPVSYGIFKAFRLCDEHLMGIEIHANVIMNILNRNFLRHPNSIICALWIFIASVFSALVLEMVSPFVGAILSILFVSLGFYYSYISYNYLGQVFHIVPIIVAIFSVWVVNTLTNYIKQRRKANSTKAMFSKFVSADVVQYMLDNPELVRPGGTKTELTIFFSDVAGFTTISEGLSPEDLVVLLNEYLGAMTDLLFEYGGTLDKFIGDAVMAFWNFPKKQEDHAVRAVLCAIAMQKKIKELQVDWAKRGFPKVAARCGINTQDVVVGYMGSQKAQMNFTCMGDGVNLASRLEGANKEYGTMMMVSDNTYQRVKHAVRGRFLDFLAVKGKKEPVKVYELVCKYGDEPEGWFEKTELYDKAIQLHLERKWDEAIATFEEVLKRWPDDGPSKTYINRCNEYKDNPPPEGWDGRYILTHK